MAINLVYRYKVYIVSGLQWGNLDFYFTVHWCKNGVCEILILNLYHYIA